MRTTVTLDENLVRELVEISGAKTKTAAVASAVREKVRRAKLERLAGLLGTVDVDAEAIKSGDDADLRRTELLDGIGRGDDE